MTSTLCCVGNICSFHTLIRETYKHLLFSGIYISRQFSFQLSHVIWYFTIFQLFPDVCTLRKCILQNNRSLNATNPFCNISFQWALSKCFERSFRHYTIFACFMLVHVISGISHQLFSLMGVSFLPLHMFPSNLLPMNWIWEDLHLKPLYLLYILSSN